MIFVGGEFVLRNFICTFALGFFVNGYFNHVHILLEFHDLLHFGLDFDIFDIFPEFDLKMLEIYISQSILNGFFRVLKMVIKSSLLALSSLRIHSLSYLNISG